MNAIGAISSVSGVSGISGASVIGNTSSISGASSATDGTLTGSQAPGDSFTNALSDAFGQLNGQLNTADASMASFASGGSADISTVMLQMESASVSLKAAVDVRDKMLEAYQEIMRTQI